MTGSDLQIQLAGDFPAFRIRISLLWTIGVIITQNKPQN